MTLYRFHVRDAAGLIEDEEGIDLPDLASVFKYALRSAREFSAEAEPAADMVFEVADSTGRTVLTVPICDLSASKRPVARAHLHFAANTQKAPPFA
jgi:hypothetical protein